MGPGVGLRGSSRRGQLGRLRRRGVVRALEAIVGGGGRAAEEEQAGAAGVEVGGQGEVEVEGEEEPQLQRVEFGKRQASDFGPVFEYVLEGVYDPTSERGCCVL